MRKIPLSLAALITVGLTACGGGTSGETRAPTEDSQTSTTQAPPASTAPASQAPASSVPASSAPATKAPDNSAAGGAATPEAAAEAMLHGMANKDAKAICEVMAIQGKPMNAIGAGPACLQQWTSTLESADSTLASLKNAKVTNAKVTGDTADLQNATVTPPEAKAALLVTSKAQKIDGKWYLALGA